MVPMKDTPDELQQNVLRRLKKIEGQIRGIHSMVESGKECEDILIQVRAVKSAIASMNAVILRRYLMRCYAESEESEDQEADVERLERAIKVLTNFVDG